MEEPWKCLGRATKCRKEQQSAGKSKVEPRSSKRTPQEEHGRAWQRYYLLPFWVVFVLKTRPGGGRSGV